MKLDHATRVYLEYHEKKSRVPPADTIISLKLTLPSGERAVQVLVNEVIIPMGLLRRSAHNLSGRCRQERKPGRQVD